MSYTMQLLLPLSDSPDTKFDKEEFPLAVGMDVNSYGCFHSFFYLPNGKGFMRYYLLADDSRLYTVQQVVYEHLVHYFFETDPSIEEGSQT